jgi:hypothetical protein
VKGTNTETLNSCMICFRQCLDIPHATNLLYNQSEPEIWEGASPSPNSVFPLACYMPPSSDSFGLPQSSKMTYIYNISLFKHPLNVWLHLFTPSSFTHSLDILYPWKRALLRFAPSYVVFWAKPLCRGQGTFSWALTLPPDSCPTWMSWSAPHGLLDLLA